jgi:hypothetical protein
MSWSAGERPEWVRAVNRGEILPIAEEASLPISRDALLAEARACQGLGAGSDPRTDHDFGHTDFPSEPMIENLDRLTTALEREAALTIIGRSLTRRFLLRILEVRLQLMRYLKADPGVREEKIEKPLFVAGAPRTGTTILYQLLSADPRHRVPEGWELLRPVPPPDPDPERFAADPRIALADRELVRPQTVVSGLKAAHVYGGRKPKECLSAMSFALQSEEFTARYQIPSYDAWLTSSDMTPAYAMHELVLQVLQRRRPGTAWALKSPVHLHSLPTLFETYPDARVAITHRDPLTLLGSLTSLIANLRWAHSDTVDPETIARDHHARYQRTFDLLVDWSTSPKWPSAQIHHSLFADFLEAPVSVVEGLYAHFQIPLGGAERDAIRAELERHPQAAHGPHKYRQHDSGHGSESTRRAFERYQSYFGVPSDPLS